MLIVNGAASLLPLVKWQIDMKVQCFGQVSRLGLAWETLSTQEHTHTHRHTHTHLNREMCLCVCVCVCMCVSTYVSLNDINPWARIPFCLPSPATLTSVSQTHTHTHTHRITKLSRIHRLLLTTKYDSKARTVHHIFTHTLTQTDSSTYTAGLGLSWQPHLSSRYFLLFGLWVTDPADFTGPCSLSRSIPFNFIGAEASYYIIEFGLIMRAVQSSSTCDLLRRGAGHFV